MLNVQRYLKLNSLQALQDEFGIGVNEYDDRVVLNYNQIDSPRFHPICDECRALILEKGTWNIIARSFNRFYNLGEGHDKGHGFMRVSSFQKPPVGDHNIIPFDLTRASIVNKLDGTLITAYHYDGKWNFSTRKMAFAEGDTGFDITFDQLIRSALNFSNVMAMIESCDYADKFSWVFELTSPANRIVTPYEDTKLTLLAMVHKETAIEFDHKSLNMLAKKHGVQRPETYSISSWEELVEAANARPSMEEGYVLILEDENYINPLRIKVKNPKFVAIAHMRENGQLSPKNVLRLVMEDEVDEYLSYFPEDKKYFDLVEKVYDEFIDKILHIHLECGAIEDQKEFALTIQKQATKAQCGFLFRLRKGAGLSEILKGTEPKKLSKVLGLKELFKKEFNLVDIDED